MTFLENFCENKNQAKKSRAQRAKKFEVFSDLQGGNAKKRIKKWSKNKNRGPNIWPDSVKNKKPPKKFGRFGP